MSQSSIAARFGPWPRTEQPKDAGSRRPEAYSCTLRAGDDRGRRDATVIGRSPLEAEETDARHAQRRAGYRPPRHALAEGEEADGQREERGGSRKHGAQGDPGV